MQIPQHKFLGLYLALVPCLMGAGESAWSEMAQYRFKEARAHFSALGTREGRLGEAVALLNLQPRTESNVQQAAALLTQIMADGDRDETGLTARYMLARISQMHGATDQEIDAAQRYRELLADSPDNHPLAAQSVIKLAMLTLYSTALPREPSQRLELAAALQGRVKRPEALRDFHLLIGRAFLFYQISPEKALAHFEAAWEAGVQNFSNRSDVLVAIAELARKCGRLERARSAYEQFLIEFPRDDRGHAIKLILQEKGQKGT